MKSTDRTITECGDPPSNHAPMVRLTTQTTLNFRTQQTGIHERQLTAGDVASHDEPHYG